MKLDVILTELRRGDMIIAVDGEAVYSTYKYQTDRADGCVMLRTTQCRVVAEPTAIVRVMR